MRVCVCACARVCVTNECINKCMHVSWTFMHGVFVMSMYVCMGVLNVPSQIALPN